MSRRGAGRVLAQNVSVTGWERVPESAFDSRAACGLFTSELELGARAAAVRDRATARGPVSTGFARDMRLSLFVGSVTAGSRMGAGTQLAFRLARSSPAAELRVATAAIPIRFGYGRISRPLSWPTRASRRSRSGSAWPWRRSSRPAVLRNRQLITDGPRGLADVARNRRPGARRAADAAARTGAVARSPGRPRRAPLTVSGSSPLGGRSIQRVRSQRRARLGLCGQFARRSDQSIDPRLVP
jgi:hypothetical protein